MPLAVTLATFRMGLMTSRSLLRYVVTSGLGLFTWLAAQQPASAQVLLAQTGSSKTAVGWVIVLLCIGLGLLVVCRPNARKSPLKK
jgi:nicotinamide riboside transporter PnuC